jgi:hypothetical protein
MKYSKGPETATPGPICGLDASSLSSKSILERFLNRLGLPRSPQVGNLSGCSGEDLTKRPGSSASARSIRYDLDQGDYWSKQ